MPCVPDIRLPTKEEISQHVARRRERDSAITNHEIYDSIQVYFRNYLKENYSSSRLTIPREDIKDLEKILGLDEVDKYITDFIKGYERANPTASSLDSISALCSTAANMGRQDIVKERLMASIIGRLGYFDELYLRVVGKIADEVLGEEAAKSMKVVREC